MENIVEVRNLTKKVSKKFAIKDVSFDIKKGYVTGIVGANGAGKTTIIKMLMGLANKQSGSISIFGKDMRDEESAIKQQIGYVSDEPVFLPRATLFRNKEIIKKLSDNFDDNLYQKYIKKFDLDDSKNFDEISKGMKIKFALAMALSHNPTLLILDEPTAGIDPIFRIDMLNELYDFVSDGQKAVIMSTHITSDLDKIADYMIFVDNGSIIAYGEKDEILSSYAVISGDKIKFENIKSIALSYNFEMDRFKALINAEDIQKCKDYIVSIPSIEDLMYFYSKAEKE